MEWLNYHHLLYFHRVVKLGSISAASAELRLSQPTISKQIHELESTLGEKLLEKMGRGLAPTEMGRMVFNYAEEIFLLGREILDMVGDRPRQKPLRLQVGVTDSMPKLAVRDILRGTFSAGQAFRVVVHEGRVRDLLGQLAVHRLDVVLSDQPAPADLQLKAHNHPLGTHDISFFAPRALARKAAGNFPRSLQELPAILPGGDCGIRLGLDKWFEERGLRPNIVAECDDRELVKWLAPDVNGFFPAPKTMAREIARAVGAVRIGDADGVSETYYAITVERRIKHPGVLAITSGKNRPEKPAVSPGSGRRP